MGLFKKLFGTYSQKEIKKITPIIDKIEGLRDKFDGIVKDRDAARAYTYSLITRYKRGETLDMLLPEAFALVRATAKHVMGKEHYRVQLIGGVLLHQGRITEMKTGEGKTLVATLPAYLNALTGKGVHIVTVNEYLAERDSVEMGQIYEYLGMRVGLITSGMPSQLKKVAYEADITYGTNSEFGFDYLRDNSARSQSSLVQRELNYAIVDEVDSILIDEAKNPLIISGTPEDWNSASYERANECVKSLKPLILKEMDKKESYVDVPEHYIVDEKDRTATLTEKGVERVEAFYKIKNLADEENGEIFHRVNNALRAHGVFKRDVDYIVKNREVLLVDQSTGRIMLGRRLRDGLHQAIEAKEHARINPENRTLASVTYQNYFRLYKKLSGMTGTAMTEENEFKQIYALDVVEVPTNKDMIRVDMPDVMYRTRREKLAAIVKEIVERHAKGQPILVGTTSVEKSEELAALIRARGIPFTVLNAKDHGNEAITISQAGRPGSVTIATNMAGRGTDIILGGNADVYARTKISAYKVVSKEVPLTSDKDDKRTRTVIEYLPVGDQNVKAIERSLGRNERLIYPDKRQITRAVGEEQVDDILTTRMRADYRETIETLKPKFEKLRNEAIEAGGLFVIGTERHENRRIDNQLCGRSGRQGDVGGSRFFLSLEDDLMRLFGRTDTLYNIISRFNLPDGEPIDEKFMGGAVETAQKRREARLFELRRHTLFYDDVLNAQRIAIYEQRREYIGRSDVRNASLEHELITRLINKKYHDEPELFKKHLEENGGKVIVASRLVDIVPSDITNENLPEFFSSLLEFEDEMRKKDGEARDEVAEEARAPEEKAIIPPPKRSAGNDDESVSFMLSELKKSELSQKIISMIEKSVTRAHEAWQRGEYDEEKFRQEYAPLFTDGEQIPDDPAILSSLAVQKYARRHLKFRYEFENAFLKLFDEKFRHDQLAYGELLEGRRELKLTFTVGGKEKAQLLSNSGDLIVKDGAIVFDPLLHMEKHLLLGMLDDAWVDHLELVDELRDYVGLSSYAQRDPLVVFKLEASRLYNEMIGTIYDNMSRKIISITPQKMQLETVFTMRKTAQIIHGKLPGRNDPCPCGSGKKFKSCCEALYNRTTK